MVRHDVPVPTPAEGEVLVAVCAAGVDNTDLWTRRGAYGRPTTPTPSPVGVAIRWRSRGIQGGDAVRRMVAAGDGAGEALLGRRVLVDPASGSHCRHIA